MSIKSERFLSFSIMLLMLIFVVRDIFSIGINPYLITFILSSIACVLSYRDLIAYSCFLLPLSCGVQSFIWIVIVCCIIYKKRIIPNQTLILFLFFVVLELFDQSRTIIVEPQIKNTIFYFTALFVVLYLVFDDTQAMNPSKNIRYFLYGSAFLLTVLFIRIILQYGMDEILTGAIRYKLDDTTISGDYVFFTNANNLGLYSAVCFTILLYIGKEKLNLSSSLYILLLSLILMGGMLTFSRTWLILTTLFLFLYFIVAKKNKSFLFMLFVFIIFSILAFSSNYFSSIMEIFEARLNGDDLRDGAGRTDLLSSYNQFFVQHPKYWLTGTGAVYYQSICQQPNSMHNMIQQIYVCYGFLGLAGVGVLFYSIFKKKITFVKHIQNYAPIICFLIFLQTVQFFNPIFCMYPLVVCTFCLKIHKTTYAS